MTLGRMRTFTDDEVVDVVVVGTGAGGAPLLARLAQAGLKVVALEAGPDFEMREFTPDELESTKINWMSERLSGGGDPTAFGPNNSGFGVGGSTLHWGAFTPRPDARDLRLRSDTGEGRDWPVDHAELIRYIVEVEADIGVSGPEHYPRDPSRRYLYPPVRRNGSSDAMIRGCDALGITATDGPAAILTRDRDQPHYGRRRATLDNGDIHQGDRFGAKATTAITYIPAAVAAGAEVRPDSFVHGIERDAAGRVTGVVYRRGGVDHRQRCAQLVLAAGGVETPRLLLHTGVANANGQVGRGFMAHGGVQVWGTFDEPIRGYRGYPSSIISEDFVRPGDADFVGGYLLQSLGVMPLNFGTQLVRGAGLWGDDLMSAVDEYPFSAGVGMNGECLPSDANRLTLSDELAEDGMPRAEVTFTQGENEAAINRHGVAVMERILRAAGARSTRVMQRSCHTLGTARMSDDPDDGVVDASGRSHEVENLWICDNSTFPSALSANPALTQMALALRTADRMLAGR
ncbi:GMC family oxidoreductase [Microbacterium sp. EYE_5]|uniref:GMC family oxidoreductase n=1 Tax=unclassified Microbacterium TaxID=2609290 RepID=UPI002004A669|nr:MULTISPECIES: GMC family oxidoreductase [unclassified Microbacterium]MCK6079028.1 GMC family oxidoreductase [Microbacterium sp. EYE_382]MCK6084298.1 GMC family oxidoreductase [Microbacterium sp. EYE_384]MCK6123473.1 GMC family oxidoreductase [Microbacterium sp. EYE_80]MCK6125062.1 GMC family oxidoreductase [Microbacterium sp. EYE_79]MCK6142892.1 GMC family oxidoreductase [Microbacterium sp. EYE_39]